MSRITFSVPVWLLQVLVILASMAAGAGLYGWYLGAPMTPGAPDDVPAVITGKAIAFDADDIEIQGMRVRLQGIDGLEGRKACCFLDKPWDCAGEAAAALQRKLKGKTVTCRVQGRTTKKRPLAHCFADGENINEWMVKNGWAYAYRKYSLAYTGAEKSARRGKRGIWRGRFVEAEQRRKLRKLKPRPACLKDPCMPCPQ